MARPFDFSLVTPEKIAFRGKVEFISTKSVIGELGIYVDHIPMVAMLVPWQLKIILEDAQTKFFELPEGGVLQIAEDHAVTIGAPAANLIEA